MTIVGSALLILALLGCPRGESVSSDPPTEAVPQAETAPDGPRVDDVIVVVIDTLRADRLGSYGYAQPTSPNLDLLAERGVRFARAYTTATWTRPAMATLFTGRHGREVGGAALRGMTFGERGKMLKALSGALHEHREELIDIAVANGGNTRGDAKFDIDGATGTLAAYAHFAKSLPDTPFLLDGDGMQLGRTKRFWGQHVRVPRRGVAVHINAFNFPAWGTFEKAACALLAAAQARGLGTAAVTSRGLDTARTVTSSWRPAGRSRNSA